MAQRCHGLFKQSFKPFGDLRDRLVGTAFQLHRDGAVTENFRRNDADEPRITALWRN